jgi:hypothetical protein
MLVRTIRRGEQIRKRGRTTWRVWLLRMRCRYLHGMRSGHGVGGGHYLRSWGMSEYTCNKCGREYHSEEIGYRRSVRDPWNDRKVWWLHRRWTKEQMSGSTGETG